VDLTEAAAHAEVFQGVDAADSGPCSVRAGCAAQGQVPLIGKARLVAYGNRLPLAYHLSEDVSRGRIGSLFGPLEGGLLRLEGGRQDPASLDEWAGERQREKPLAGSPSAARSRPGSAGALLLQGQAYVPSDAQRAIATGEEANLEEADLHSGRSRRGAAQPSLWLAP
jgi:hypothetical protein